MDKIPTPSKRRTVSKSKKNNSGLGPSVKFVSPIVSGLIYKTEGWEKISRFVPVHLCQEG